MTFVSGPGSPGAIRVDQQGAVPWAVSVPCSSVHVASGAVAPRTASSVGPSVHLFNGVSDHSAHAGAVKPVRTTPKTAIVNRYMVNSSLVAKLP